MKNLCVSVLFAVVLLGLNARSAMASKVFGTEFTAKYVKAEPENEKEQAFAAAVKKAKCYVCHVKGKKKEVCNTYGAALSKLLDHDDFEKERCESEPEKVKQEIQAALAKVEAEKDACGATFGDLLAAGKPPDKTAVEAEASEEAEE